LKDNPVPEQERQIKMRQAWFNQVKEITHNVVKAYRYYSLARMTPTINGITGT
jgi:hypothetical protein